MKYVIITAADFGLCSEVNQAVIQAHKKGILTCASLMVSAGATEEAVALAKAHPSLKVGLHLVMVEGLSVLPKKEIPDLVDVVGKFSKRIISSGVRYFFSKKIKCQIAKECEAQIKEFLATGLKIDHLNSHNHLHIHPAILDIIIPLVKKYHIPAVRLPWQGIRTLKRRQSVRAVVMLPWVIRMRLKLQKNRIAYNQEIFGLYETGFMLEQTWLRLIPKIRRGVTEIYCHPAAQKILYLKQTPPSYHHVEEFAALLSLKVKENLERKNAVLTCFSDIS